MLTQSHHVWDNLMHVQALDYSVFCWISQQFVEKLILTEVCILPGYFYIIYYILHYVRYFWRLFNIMVKLYALHYIQNFRNSSSCKDEKLNLIHAMVSHYFMHAVPLATISKPKQISYQQTLIQLQLIWYLLYFKLDFFCVDIFGFYIVEMFEI